MLQTQIDTGIASKDDAFYKTRDKARARAHVLTCVSCSGVRGGSGGCISPVPYKAP